MLPSVHSHLTLRIRFHLEVTDAHRHFDMIQVRLELTSRNVHDPHKMTFLHPSGAVSYAIIRPPSVNLHSLDKEKRFPVLLFLHGAGVEADSHQARHILDAVPHIHAWVVVPTGMTPWSADDWHAWGMADVKAAVAAIPDWVTAMQWTGPRVATDQWLVSGHSNGGQGTWYCLSHFPDQIIAAAPVSGYSSIENYVAYTMWTEADPLLSAIPAIARSNFRHELLAANYHDVPILQQHGSDDDNVPPYHSRLMNYLVKMIGSPAEYAELPKKGHWWDGVMVTQPLQQFYHNQLDSETRAREPPCHFSLVCADTADGGSRYGITIDQLKSPDQYGEIDATMLVEGNEKVWRISTSNIRRFHFTDNAHPFPYFDLLVLDDSRFSFRRSWFLGRTFVQLSTGIWETQPLLDWKPVRERHGRQRGTMSAILHSSGPFQIVSCVSESFGLAVQVSRNLLQYYGADADILEFSDHAEAARHGGNVITLALGTRVPEPYFQVFPIQITPEGVYLCHLSNQRSRTYVVAEGLGAIFLRPLPKERLELLVWGYDLLGLRHAAKLIPTLTGAGQPDFVITSKKSGWLGQAGAMAMGFFDYSWNISDASYLS